MTEPQERSWRPRWWVVATTVVNFVLGVSCLTHELTSELDRPALLAACLVLLLGSPGVLALDRFTVQRKP